MRNTCNLAAAVLYSVNENDSRILKEGVPMKKTILWALLCALILTGCGQTDQPETEEPEKLQIVATIFPAYDLARAAAGDLADVHLLLPPGAESHSYEPTPADILSIQECDLFVTLGGESGAWVDTILNAIDMEGETLRMMDQVEVLEEMTVEGMQEMPGHHHHHHAGEEDHDHDAHHGTEEDHHEEPDDHDHDQHHGHDHELGAVLDLDEHVWTAPLNAAAITRAIGEKLGELDPANAAGYTANAEGYAAQLEDLDCQFADFFGGLEDRTMVFGDRFPLRYFADAYDIPYYAAFPGCSTQTEPSAATIAFLTEEVEEEDISTVFYIEFSNHLVADSIAEATGTQTALFHTCHNISPEDLAAGETYLSLMTRNLQTLKDTLGRQ